MLLDPLNKWFQQKTVDIQQHEQPLTAPSSHSSSKDKVPQFGSICEWKHKVSTFTAYKVSVLIQCEKELIICYCLKGGYVAVITRTVVIMNCVVHVLLPIHNRTLWTLKCSIFWISPMTTLCLFFACTSKH